MMIFYFDNISQPTGTANLKDSVSFQKHSAAMKRFRISHPRLESVKHNNLFEITRLFD